MTSDNPFSITAWVKPDVVNANQIVVAFGSDAGSSYEGKRTAMFISSSAVPTLAFWGNDVTGGTISANVWTHLAMTFAGGNRTSANSAIYINGISQSLSGGTASALDLSDMDFAYIGVDESVGQDYDGEIAQVGIWQGALTQAQVQSVMESTSYAKIPASIKNTLGGE